jgi:hypothetical protein
MGKASGNYSKLEPPLEADAESINDLWSSASAVAIWLAYFDLYKIV